MLVHVPHGHVAKHEPVGPVGPDAHVLVALGGTLVARGHPAGVDHHVVRADSRALDLEVAADARPEVGDPVPVLQRRLRVRSRPERTAHHRDQVLIVRALELVGVGHGAGLVLAVAVLPVVDLLEARALRVVGRLGPGLLLGVDPGHDHHAVVVARGRDRVLDRAELAARLQPLVEGEELATLLRADVTRTLGGAQLVALRPRLADGLANAGDRVALAHHARVADRAWRPARCRGSGPSGPSRRWPG